MTASHAKVADFMATFPEYAIFRRFRTLNMRNLLYLQAEMALLERDLAFLDQRADLREEAKSWSKRRESDRSRDQNYRDKVMQIRENLKQYNEALAVQAYISRLEEPPSSNAEYLYGWLTRSDLGNYPIDYSEIQAWDECLRKDLVALTPEVYHDAFSRWFRDNAIPWYHNAVGERTKASQATSQRSPPFLKLFANQRLQQNSHPQFGASFNSYSDSAVTRVLQIAGTVVASLLPVVSIVVLFFLQSNIIRLIVVIVASACFSLAVALMTNGRLIEVFAATSACVGTSCTSISSQRY